MKLTKSKLKQIIKEELNEIDDDDLAALRPQEENQELVAIANKALHEALRTVKALETVTNFNMEEELMRCMSCGNDGMTVRRKDVEYGWSGLDNVVLLNVEIATCPNCNDEEVALPRVAELHRVLAECLVKKPSRLTAKEIRFLRKHMGWSGEDFAS